jgi:tRNA nucleotidyltransferase (CCA-adding enzyme)
MPPSPAAPLPIALEAVPPPVHAAVATLQGVGQPAFLVGSCVRALLSGEPVRDFEVISFAATGDVLAQFPSAVVTGRAAGVVTVPTSSGPVDISRPHFGARIEDELAHRDFTLHAMAYDPCAGQLIDPHDGRSDLAKGLLRAVGDPEARFAEDPVRALRAARLVACLGLEASAALERGMRGAAQALRHAANARERQELRALLLAPHAPLGVMLLRRGGIEPVLVPDAADDAPAVLGALRFDLDLRLAAWLRGAPVARVLRRLRHPRHRSVRIERLLRMHPIDAPGRDAFDPRLRRLARRAPRDFEDLLALRRAEIAAREEGAAALAQLEQLIEAVERSQRAEALERVRTQLALDGRAVMQYLDCAPGPEVGRALRYLTQAVTEDPSRNEPDILRALLDAWRDAR